MSASAFDLLCCNACWGASELADGASRRAADPVDSQLGGSVAPRSFGSEFSRDRRRVQSDLSPISPPTPPTQPTRLSGPSSMTDSSPPPHTSKHQLDEPAGPPSAKKLKTGTLDSFLIKPKSNSSPKSSPAKASLKATDTNVGEKTPGETVTTTHTVSTETSTELGAAEPAEGAVAETIEETTTNKDKPTLQTTLDLTSVQPSAPAKSTASSEGFDPEAWLESLATAASGPSTRDLLALEARTMDSSWLALVKGELTKSYFLGLKRFLWTQGVQGEDSKVGKVFPPGKSLSIGSSTNPTSHIPSLNLLPTRSQGYLCLEQVYASDQSASSDHWPGPVPRTG